MKVDTIQFRKALGSFTTGICNIAVFDQAAQKPVGLTVNSLASVSLKPPLLHFCLDKKSHIFDYFIDNDYFCVNILTSTQKDISIKFSNGTKDPWATTDYQIIEDHFIEIKNALTHIHCKITSRIEQGDHLVITGEVLKTHHHPDPDTLPLTYFRGSYHELS